MKILVIDDEASIVNLIAMNLKLEGYAVDTAGTGAAALAQFKKAQPDLVLLDIMLPDCSGYDLIAQLQAIEREVPIIMLTAKGQLNDRLLGFQLGADDYITKPFNSAELLLRIKAVSKRLSHHSDMTTQQYFSLNNEKLKIYMQQRKVQVDDMTITLTYKEYDTLLLLAKNANQVFTREVLLERVWGYEYEGNTRAVDVLVQRLRKKLGNCATMLKTIYGVGYTIADE